MWKIKRLIVAVLILVVAVVMALRGCPRVRKSLGIAHGSTKADITDIARTTVS